MSQRNSGRVRIERDAYQTPAWVTHTLIDDLERAGMLPVVDADGVIRTVWEPAAGKAQMADALVERGYPVFASDIVPDDGKAVQYDFLGDEMVPCPADTGVIITNPPYEFAYAFAVRALDLMQPRGGLVAMLLRVDWDSAVGRRLLFADEPGFARKLVLTKRIAWFPPLVAAPGQAPTRQGSPSENHAWFVWDFGRRMQLGVGPAVSYGPAPTQKRRT